MIAIVARGACSPLGEGADAFDVGRVGDRAATRVLRDDELAAAGLARPLAARAMLRIPEGVDRATALLEHALSECARDLDDALPRWRSMRVGAAIGTSSGGMRSFETIEGLSDSVDPRRSLPSALAATYIGPFITAARPVTFEPVSLVLAACASSTIAVGLGRAWLEDDRCDLVLCGGFDAVSVFVAAGFESLRATCAESGPMPFRMGRTGLALGEGAAVVALVREPMARQAARVHAWVTGFASTCDAVHLTAPDVDGRGLGRAASQAIADSGEARIDLVSAHGTATRQNDASEAKAIVSSLRDLGPIPPVFSFKGTVGHLLGASGIIEILAAVSAMQRGVVPASAGEGDAEPGVRVLDRAEASELRTTLKLSSAFGGVNAALVLSADRPRSSRPLASANARREVYLSTAVSSLLTDVNGSRLSERTGYGVDRIARADDLVRLAMSAVAALEDEHGGAGSLRGAGVVVGHGLATIETNARFLERILTAGAGRAEPRRFPYTTPNAVAGECAVVFGLTGPAFAVGGGPHGGIEALGVGADLVRSRLVERVVVVAVDDAQDATARLAPGTTSGAVALLLQAAAPPELPPGAWAARLVSCVLRLDAMARPPDVGRLPPMSAHCALLPLLRGPRSGRAKGGVSTHEEHAGKVASGTTTELHAEAPWGGFAKAQVFWL